LFHHAPNNAHHLLDETPHGRAAAIVRALRSAYSSDDTDCIACLHCVSIKSGAVLDPPVRTSLLAAYARAERGAGAGAALALFREAVAPDVILWNAAIGAMTMTCRYDDAAALFRRMARELGEFDSTTVVVTARNGASWHGGQEVPRRSLSQRVERSR
jgi:pentatricopeptide repeat protein